jgi:hypothetical protein
MLPREVFPVSNDEGFPIMAGVARVGVLTVPGLDQRAKNKTRPGPSDGKKPNPRPTEINVVSDDGCPILAVVSGVGVFAGSRPLSPSESEKQKANPARFTPQQEAKASVSPKSTSFATATIQK